MQLYKTAVIGLPSKWSGSQSDAAKDRNALWEQYKDQGKRSDITTTPVDVPTNKQGLIEFLNNLS